jgi:uncharacterized NAD(P)/FAD-binding protein YdhS
VRVARVINCTGPESDVRRAEDPFVRHLLQAGLARADGVGLGLDTDDVAAVIDTRGVAQRAVVVAGTAAARSVTVADGEACAPRRPTAVHGGQSTPTSPGS